MMNMMHTTGSATGLTALWGIHALSVVFFFAGIILLLFWAVKTFTPAQLQKWGIGLAVAGTIGCLLALGGAGSSGIGGPGGMKCAMMNTMGGTMEMSDDGHQMNMDDDAMSMSMDDMAGMLEGKTGDAFDKAFIEGMIPHHQGAIDMAIAAQQSAKHQEIKDMANAIITAQQREIDQMNQWMKDWGYNQ